MLQDSELSAPAPEVPERQKSNSHRIPKILDTFQYPLKHQSKESSLLNSTLIICILNNLHFQTVKFFLGKANPSVTI